MSEVDRKAFDMMVNAGKSFDFEAMKEEALGRYTELGLENPEATWDELMTYFNPALLVMGSIGAKYIKLPNPQKMKSYASALSSKVSAAANKAAPALKSVKDNFVQRWRDRFIKNNVRPFLTTTSKGSVKMDHLTAKLVDRGPRQVTKQIKNISNEKLMTDPEIKRYVRSYESEMLQRQYWKHTDEYSKIRSQVTKVTGGRSQKQLLKKHGEDLIKRGDWVKDFVKVNPRTGKIIGGDWKRTMLAHKESMKVLKKNTEEFKELIRKTYPNIKVK